MSEKDDEHPIAEGLGCLLVGMGVGSVIAGVGFGVAFIIKAIFH